MTRGAKLLCMLIILASLALMFSGCGGMLIPNLSGDIVKDGIRCTTLSGPPPSGRTTLMHVPPDRKVTVMMGPDCQVQKMEVGESKSEPVAPALKKEMQ